MIEDINYISETAQRFAEWINEKIAVVIIKEIDNFIWLEQIIANDLANRIKLFNESKDSVTDEEIKSAMKEPTIDFKNTTEKLQYAFKALLQQNYTFTHDIDKAWRVYIKFFKLEKEVVYQLNTSYTIWIDIKPNII